MSGFWIIKCQVAQKLLYFNHGIGTLCFFRGILLSTLFLSFDLMRAFNVLHLNLFLLLRFGVQFLAFQISDYFFILVVL